jgi:hypothetical protein
LQALGVAGDIATIAAPLTGGASAVLGALLKAPRAAQKSSAIFNSVDRFPSLSKSEESLVAASSAPDEDIAGLGKVVVEKVDPNDLEGSRKRFQELKALTANYKQDRAKARLIKLDTGEDAIQYMQPPTEVTTLNISDLTATQSDVVLGGDASLSDTMPLVVKKEGKFFIRDGHHRLAQKAISGESSAKVRLVDLDKATDVASDVAGIAKVEPPTETQPGIIAFHGSGADFDEFRLDKIGTGEGNQAFGYGLYFSDSEDIGKFYKNQILKTQNVEYKGKPIKFNNPDDRDILDKELIVQGLVRDRILGGKFNSQEAIDSVINQLEQTIENSYDLSQPFKNVIDKEGYNSLVADLDYAKTLKADDFNYQEGKVYKVAIQPKPEELLDYDKPLSEQPKNVQDFYKNFKNSELGKLANESLNGELDRVTNPTGERIYGYVVEGAAGKIFGNNPSRELVQQVQKNKDDYKLVTEELLKANIKGLKFKSGQLSNIADSDATNFVIFDDKIINILEKYGIVGPVAVSATAAALRDDDGSS